MAKVNLSAPWTTLYRQFQAFFKHDPQVKVVYNESGPEIQLFVECPHKAAALSQLLDSTRVFGNISVKITVIQTVFTANSPTVVEDSPNTDMANIKNALVGHDAVVAVHDIPQAFGTPLCYVVFKREVVQFYNDNLQDLNGLTSTLYQDLANVVFTHHNAVFFCTDAPQNLGKPLGEWP